MSDKEEWRPLVGETVWDVSDDPQPWALVAVDNLDLADVALVAVRLLTRLTAGRTTPEMRGFGKDHFQPTKMYALKAAVRQLRKRADDARAAADDLEAAVASWESDPV